MPIKRFVTRSIHDAPDIERLHEYVYATIQTVREKYGIDNVNKIILGSNCYQKLLDISPLAFVSVYKANYLEAVWVPSLYSVPYIVDKDCTLVRNADEFVIELGDNTRAFQLEYTMHFETHDDECIDIAENDFLSLLNAPQTTVKENTI